MAIALMYRTHRQGVFPHSVVSTYYFVMPVRGRREGENYHV